jgi:hypothetical protein
MEYAVTFWRSQVQVFTSTRVNFSFGGSPEAHAGIARTVLQHDCIFSHPFSINYLLSNQSELLLMTMIAERVCMSHRTSRAEVLVAAILTGQE